MLKIDIEPGESIRIGDYATLTLEDKSGKRARLSFDADRSIPIEKTKKRSTAARLAAESGITGLSAA